MIYPEEDTLSSMLLQDEAASEAYLSANPDVRDAVEQGRIVSGFAHWLEFGNAEGRIWPATEEASPQAEPEVVVEFADRIEERDQYLTYGIDRIAHEGIEIGA